MDELVQAMTVEQLEVMKTQPEFASNESVVKILDGYIASKSKEEEQAHAREDFAKMVEDLASTLPHPDDIYNVHLRWAEVEVQDLDNPEEVEVPKLHEDTGKPVRDHGKPVMVMETRYPTIKEFRWVVEVNKAMKVTQGEGASKSGNGKRAIKVYKRDGLALTELGTFASASEACKSLNVPVGTDSAMRVLARDGYIIEPAS